CCCFIRAVSTRHSSSLCLLFLFFFNDPPSTEIYTLSLHDALPISFRLAKGVSKHAVRFNFSDTLRKSLMKLGFFSSKCTCMSTIDRKSTRLNSSHDQISYAVFCLKKKTITKRQHETPNTTHTPSQL